MSTELNKLRPEEAYERLVDPAMVDRLIAAAREEDLGGVGDVTSLHFVPAGVRATGRIRCREPGVLAGAALLPRILAEYDAALKLNARSADGAELTAGATVAEIAGPLRSLLAAERVLLNFLTHLSGIATRTAHFVEAVSGTEAQIYDTRKTLPGWRGLARYAVRCGGACNHRIGLYDAVLVKDNHIARVSAAELQATLRRGIESARSAQPPPRFIEVEVDTLEQLRAVLELDVDIVLLDNMATSQLAEAVAERDRVKQGVALEASGGVDLRSVRAIAETGIDRIAVGSLTHSAPALDIGLDIERTAER